MATGLTIDIERARRCASENQRTKGFLLSYLVYVCVDHDVLKKVKSYLNGK